VNRQIDSPIYQCSFKLANKYPDAQRRHIQTLIFVASCLDNDDLELNIRISVYERVDNMASLRQCKLASASTYSDEARRNGRSR
jgi:hypothetical protein